MLKILIDNLTNKYLDYMVKDFNYFCKTMLIIFVKLLKISVRYCWCAYLTLANVIHATVGAHMSAASVGTSILLNINTKLYKII
jgi:hypothetical protein